MQKTRHYYLLSKQEFEINFRLIYKSPLSLYCCLFYGCMVKITPYTAVTDAMLPSKSKTAGNQLTYKHFAKAPETNCWLTVLLKT